MDSQDYTLSVCVSGFKTELKHPKLQHTDYCDFISISIFILFILKSVDADDRIVIRL